MNGDEADRACENCGALLRPDAPACAACGKLVPAPLSADTLAPAQPLAATRISRSAEVLFGIATGLAGGAALAVVLVLVSAVIVGLTRDHNAQAPFLVGIGVDLLVLVALLVFGVRFAARGRVLLGTSLIVAGIVAALPAVACDLMLSSMRAMQ